MPHAVTATSDGKSYSYDCNGNLLSDRERTFAWDADNKPVSITQGGDVTTFAYSGDGARMKKQGPTQTVRYAPGFEDHATDAAQVKHITAAGLRIATRVVGGPNAGTYFTHGDHLGGLNVLTNAQGVEVQRLTYLPFGETHTNTGSVDFDQRRFTGQEQDPETGLYFYQARYYNPALGRFISPDSIVPEPGNPQSLNRYSYVTNNPLRYTDPTGHFFGLDDLIIGVVVGAIIGGTTAAITGGNVGKGILTGAITGGFMGAAGGAIASYTTATGQALSPVLQAGIYGTVGAAAGATNAAISGTNVGQAALWGGMFSAAASYVGTPNFQPFGDSAAGSIGNRLFNSGLTGAAFGAAYAGMTGGDIGQGATMGALGWAAGEAGNMLVGHAVGLIGSGGKAPIFENGAFYYDVNTPGWITFGNVVTGPYGSLDNPYRLPDGRTFTYREHELGHASPQGTLLGPAYIPAHAASLTVGGMVGTVTGYGFVDGTHSFGLLERYWHPVPAY